MSNHCNGLFDLCCVRRMTCLSKYILIISSNGGEICICYFLCAVPLEKSHIDALDFQGCRETLAGREIPLITGENSKALVNQAGDAVQGWDGLHLWAFAPQKRISTLSSRSGMQTSGVVITCKQFTLQASL